uniref:Helicase SEN1 beta-barrel domain-containing protein n=1 Tax=Vitis vinifera TaxID=29760 RepID=F6GYM0_VITVI
MIIELDDEEDDDELPFVLDVEEKHSSSWSEYSEQSKITSQDCRRWRCIPMLWLEVLVEINPSVLPISVSKAVFWARSRFALVEPEKNAEMEVPVKNWLSFSAKEISSSFGWKVPTGSDDGGDGKESQNSMKVSTMCIPLIRTFKRLTAHYIVQMEQEELRKQWIWEPRMGESLILLLLEPNDNVRQVGKCLLEQVSNMRGLAHCLQFLCSCTLSMSATYNGLRHALRLVQVDSVLLNFETLHHFFFVLCKLLKEGVICTSDPQRHSSGIKNISKFSSQGGFLRQPAFDSFPENVNGHSSVDDSKSREKFSCLLSEITWPFIRKCLVEGKAFVDYKISQLTLGYLFENHALLSKRTKASVRIFSLKDISYRLVLPRFIFYQIRWGLRLSFCWVGYWRQTMISLLHLLKGSCSDKSASFIRAIENLISCDSLMMDELTEQVAHLSVSLSNEASCIVGKTDLKSKAFFSEDSSFERQHSASDLQPFASDDMDVQILDSVTVSNKMDNNSVIILSDDETEKQISSNKVILSDNELSHCMVHGKPVAPGADKEASQDDLARKSISEYDTSKQFLEAFQQRDDSDTSGLASQKQELDTTKDRQISASHPKPKSVDSRRKEINSKFKVKDSFPSQFKGNLVSTSDKTANLKIMDQALNRVALKTGETAIKESVRDIADDPWELAVKSLKPHQSCLTKPSASIPKRQVIQLQLPGENRSGYLRKLDAGVKRFKPPKLDDWYRPILEIDYFVTVGLASASKDESQTVNKLKEVPMCFESPDQYVDIFRPLVLEEFKAQLHSSFLEMSSSEGMCCGSASVLSVERIDDFHLVRCVHDGSDSAAYRTFSENDLVLLTRQPLQNSSHEVHMVGKEQPVLRVTPSQSVVPTFIIASFIRADAVII